MSLHHTLFIGDYNDATRKGRGLARKVALDLAALEFQAFTVVDATGFWAGTPEDTLVLHVTTQTDAEHAAVLAFAATLAAVLQQDCIAVESYPSTFQLVEGA